HDHLLVGGQLILSVMNPRYLRGIGATRPTDWEHYYDVNLPGNSGALTVKWRVTGLCERQQIVAEECLYELTRNGSLYRHEISKGEHKWYSEEQLLAMLNEAGFSDIVVTGDYS